MGPTKRRVLVVDDDPRVALAVQRALSAHGYDVEHIGTPEQIDALIDTRIRAEVWDAILLDIGIGERSGLDVLARLRAANDPTAIVILTGDDTAGTATTALRGGAFHYLVKPPRMAALLDAVDLAVRHTEAQRGPARPGGDEREDGLLLGQSDAMTELRRMVANIAATNVSVLIVGESGVGKEVVARALHQASSRADHAFVPLNCGAIPEGIIDSELFGHTRGAFTGATSARPGVFVEADGGTLFLDEIGDMPLPLQARLLRTLQEHEVRAVGSDSARAIDVRVLAATNVDLARAVQEGRFRADLYFRLNVVNLRVPSLRERSEDIPELIAALFQRHRGVQRPTISGDVIEALMAYSWPGNVRELENALLHALALTKEGSIELESLPRSIWTARRLPRMAFGSGVLAQIKPGEAESELPLIEAKKRAAAEVERAYLVRVLEHARGSVTAAARQAGIDRTNFRRLLQRHGIDPSRFKL